MLYCILLIFSVLLCIIVDYSDVYISFWMFVYVWCFLVFFDFELVCNFICRYVFELDDVDVYCFLYLDSSDLGFCKFFLKYVVFIFWVMYFVFFCWFNILCKNLSFFFFLELILVVLYIFVNIVVLLVVVWKVFFKDLMIWIV